MYATHVVVLIGTSIVCCVVDKDLSAIEADAGKINTNSTCPRANGKYFKTVIRLAHTYRPSSGIYIGHVQAKWLP